MNLVRWQPRTLVRNRFAGPDSEWDRLFDWAFGAMEPSWARPMTPAIDVVEEESRYLVRADLPGLTKDEVEITYQDGTLTIKGERKMESKSEGGRAYCRERFEGKFGRNLQLPEKVDPSRIEASMKDGILEVILPFSPEAQPRKIQVRG